MQVHGLRRGVPGGLLLRGRDECIDCGVCEPECPVEAILPDTEDEAQRWLELNREYSTGPWPSITRKKEPPADAYRDTPGKYARFFTPEPGQGT